jgi:hypothetical protein
VAARYPEATRRVPKGTPPAFPTPAIPPAGRLALYGRRRRGCC